MILMKKMPYNSTNNYEWGQQEPPYDKNVPQYQSKSHHHGYARDYPAPITSLNNEVAWRQQVNNHSMNYMQNNSYFSQNNTSYPRGLNNKQLPPQPPPPKRATKRRFRHDLPGPAGAWFQLHKQQNKRNKNINTEPIKSELVSKEEPDDIIQTTKTKKSNDSTKNRVQLFKDYSSKLNDCNAWNTMCYTHERIVPSFPSFTSRLYNVDDKIIANTMAAQYRNLLRNTLPPEQSLIHEIHNGAFDIHHLTPSIHKNDLCIPLLFGYVSSISCHTHSDWTAVIVDEAYSADGKGVTCWLEEKLVKRHPGWIRPGVVWMLQGAKLALFASNEECDDDLQEENGGTNDISPSTEAARGGYAVDRMILVGEDSLVYAWTPEEASAFFTNDDFGMLLERRCNVDLGSGAEGEVVSKERVNDHHQSLPERNGDNGIVEQQHTPRVKIQRTSPSNTNDKQNLNMIPSVRKKTQASCNFTSFENGDTSSTSNSPAGKECTLINTPSRDSIQQDLSTQNSTICKRSVLIPLPSHLNTSNTSFQPNAYQKQFCTIETTTSCNSTSIITNDTPAKNKSSTDKKPIRNNHYQRSQSLTCKSSMSPKVPQYGLPNSDSFVDSLDIDDCQTVHTSKCGNDRSEQNADDCQQHMSIVEHQMIKSDASTIPLFDTANVANNNQNKSSVQETLSPKVTNTIVTPKRSKTFGSTELHCPSTCDSLDVGDDGLFYTNNVTVSSEEPAAATSANDPQQNVHTSIHATMPRIQNLHVPPERTTPSDNVMNANISSLKSGTFLFDNIDDNDLDSLGEEDDV